MKKKTIITMLIFVFVIGIGATFYFLKGKSLLESKNKSIGHKEAEERIQMLLLTDFNEIKSKSKKMKLDLISSDDNTQIGFEKLNLGNVDCDVAYQYKDKKIVNVVGGIFPEKTIDSAKTDKDKIEVLKDNIIDICNVFTVMFKTEVADAYKIYANEGYRLELDDQSSYKKIIDGKAMFSVCIKDSENSYWKIYSQNYEGKLYFSFMRSFDKEMQKDWTADIDLIK